MTQVIVLVLLLCSAVRKRRNRGKNLRSPSVNFTLKGKTHTLLKVFVKEYNDYLSDGESLVTMNDAIFKVFNALNDISHHTVNKIIKGDFVNVTVSR